MQIPYRQGLRALLPFMLAWHAMPAAQAQILPPWRVDTLASRDVDVWSEQARPDKAPSDNAPVDDLAFSAIAQGGPWAASERQPLKGVQPILFAHARQGQWSECLRKLQDSDAHPGMRDRDGATLLTLAARQGRLDAVRELVRRGADVEQRGLNGETPLGAAAIGGHDLIVHALLRAGADPARWSAQGQAPLHLAAREGQVPVLKTLLAGKADPRGLNKVGLMPLHEAAGTGSIATMAALVEAGIPADTLDLHGLNAVHAAAVRRHFEAVAWLRERGVQVIHPLTQVLLDKPADPLPVVY